MLGPENEPPNRACANRWVRAESWCSKASSDGYQGGFGSCESGTRRTSASAACGAITPADRGPTPVLSSARDSSGSTSKGHLVGRRRDTGLRGCLAWEGSEPE